eukprot:scaffold983_cov168-Amphora_coffeaeformis.AAC.6
MKSGNIKHIDIVQFLTDELVQNEDSAEELELFSNAMSNGAPGLNMLTVRPLPYLAEILTGVSGNPTLKHLRIVSPLSWGGWDGNYGRCVASVLSSCPVLFSVEFKYGFIPQATLQEIADNLSGSSMLRKLHLKLIHLRVSHKSVLVDLLKKVPRLTDFELDFSYRTNRDEMSEIFNGVCDFVRDSNSMKTLKFSHDVLVPVSVSGHVRADLFENNHKMEEFNYSGTIGNGAYRMWNAVMQSPATQLKISVRADIRNVSKMIHAMKMNGWSSYFELNIRGRIKWTLKKREDGITMKRSIGMEYGRLIDWNAVCRSFLSDMGFFVEALIRKNPDGTKSLDLGHDMFDLECWSAVLRHMLLHNSEFHKTIRIRKFSAFGGRNSTTMVEVLTSLLPKARFLNTLEIFGGKDLSEHHGLSLLAALKENESLLSVKLSGWFEKERRYAEISDCHVLRNRIRLIDPVLVALLPAVVNSKKTEALTAEEYKRNLCFLAIRRFLPNHRMQGSTIVSASRRPVPKSAVEEEGPTVELHNVVTVTANRDFDAMGLITRTEADPEGDD